MEQDTIATRVANSQCDHAYPEFSMSPLEVGGVGFLLSINAITCKKCGMAAKIVDSRGKVSSQTTLGYYFEDQSPPLGAETIPEVSVKVVDKSGPGTELNLSLKKLGMPSCQACGKLAAQMDAWGAEGCTARLEEIVEDILPRARSWFDNAPIREKLRVWWEGDDRLGNAITVGKAASTGNLDDALRKVIRTKVLAAIDRWDQRHTGT